MASKKCEICSNKVKNNKNKFCSTECYRVFQRSGDYKILKNRTGEYGNCKVCNIEIYISKNRKKSHKFCSRKCYLVNHSKNMIIKNCPICKIEIRTGAHKHKFCSRDCYLIDHAKIIEKFECPECKQEFEQSKALTEKKKFCSSNCSNYYTTKNPERNNRISKTLKYKYKTEERISWCKGKTKFNDSRLKSMSDNIKESYDSGERVVWNKGLKMGVKFSEKVSDGVSKAILKGEYPTGSGKFGYFYSEKNEKTLYYRSSYELQAYKILEQLSKVKSYEIEPLRIPYKFKDINRYTIPDLLITYIDDTKELIEVKPEFKLEFEQEKAKLEAMENYALNNNWLFSIWTEKQLGLN